MTVLQELVSGLETLSTEAKVSLLRFCKLLQDPVFMKEYERQKAMLGGIYPPELLEELMDRFEGGRDDGFDHLPAAFDAGGRTSSAVRCETTANGGHNGG